jgi:hypothetical protein
LGPNHIVSRFEYQWSKRTSDRRDEQLELVRACEARERLSERAATTPVEGIANAATATTSVERPAGVGAARASERLTV